MRTEIFVNAIDNTYKYGDSQYKGGLRPTFLGKVTGHPGIITEGIYRNLTSVNNSTNSMTWYFYQLSNPLYVSHQIATTGVH